MLSKGEKRPPVEDGAYLTCSMIQELNHDEFCCGKHDVSHVCRYVDEKCNLYDTAKEAGIESSYELQSHLRKFSCPNILFVP